MCPSRCAYIAVLVASLEEDAALLRTIRRWWRKRACDGSKTPLLDVGFNEDETSLSEVDMHNSWTDGADGREEVGRLQTVDNLLKFLTVAGEEDGASTRAVAYADNVALN